MCGVFGFDPQQCAVITPINQIEDGLFFGEDAVEGVALVAFAVMGGAGWGQTDRYCVDVLFDQCARCALGVNGELCADDLDQVGAGERRLLDLLCRVR